MKTIIFDIDGTITNMWPLEKLVLMSILGKKLKGNIEELYRSGIKDNYRIFCLVSKKRITKKEYYVLYARALSMLVKRNKLPMPIAYPVVDWILKNGRQYRFVYATGGLEAEILYVLRRLNLLTFFDLVNSLNKSNYRFSKRTGLPFKKLKTIFPDCVLVTDGEGDCDGAKKAGVDFLKILPGQGFKGLR